MRVTFPLLLLAGLLILGLLAGCASDHPPKHKSDRKWYQGDMDSDERTFYLDSFFNGQ
jgi:hypothetical protein